MANLCDSVRFLPNNEEDLSLGLGFRSKGHPEIGLEENKTHLATWMGSLDKSQGEIIIVVTPPPGG